MADLYIYTCVCMADLGLPDGSDSVESDCSAVDPGSIPGSGRSPGEGNGNPLQYSCLKNPMDRGAWQATVHGFTKSWTWQWQILFFWGSKITADNDCGHEIKRFLLFGRKIMKNLYTILKSRDITLLIKGHIVKAMVFPVVMYGFESWTMKKAERWRRIDAF